MTPRERWLACLKGERPDRVPTDYWATPEVTARLRKELRCETDRALWEKLGLDKSIHVRPALHDPRPGRENVWNIGKRTIVYAGGAGSYEENASHPLAAARTVDEVLRFDWPAPAWWDTGSVRAQCLDWEGYPIVGGCYEPFLLYCALRGMEQALEDLLENPELAEAALERIFTIHEDIIRRTLEAAAGRIDLIYVAEDLGGQDSLLMSPPAFRTFIKPRMKRMIDLVHSFGAKVFHHDDGAIRALLPELLALGIDVLNPIQWRCAGMERAGLARDFGPGVVFHGAVDNQQTLPFGTPEEVRREVAENIELFAGCKGYIVAPCHNLQPITPTANILALYEAAHAYGAPPRRQGKG